MESEKGIDKKGEKGERGNGKKEEEKVSTVQLKGE